MRYEVIFASYAEELRDSLPLAGKQALAGKVRRLAQDPTEDATYSPKILMPLAWRSRVVETGGASPADVVRAWCGLSPFLRLTLEPVPVGYSGLPPFRARVSDSMMFMRVPWATRRGDGSGKEPNVEIVYERVATIDVGKKIIAVAVRTPGERAGKRRQQVRKYDTFHQTLPRWWRGWCRRGSRT
ncbi:MAG: hypothetical protein ACRDQ4_00870 [Pseudonocardiaceae bacterium]